MFWISPIRRSQINCRRKYLTTKQSVQKINACFADRGIPSVITEQKYLADQDRFDLMMLMGYEHFCDCGGWE